MSSETQSDVLVVGAGVAGLAAAEALSRAGVAVTLLERKPYVGGRAYSYPHPALGEVIDSQHVLVGCCTNLIDLCQRSGIDRHIRWYDRIAFLEPATAERGTRISEIGAGLLPAPGHAAISFLSSKMLSTRDKVDIARALLKFLRGYPKHDDEPFSEWMKHSGQSERAVRHFWEPVVVSTLNDSFERCSTRYAGQVFHELFLKSSRGGRQGIPTQPLSEFYAGVAALAEKQGASVHLRSSVEGMERTPDGLWRVKTSDGASYQARNLLLALPFEQTGRVLATLPEASSQKQAILPLLSNFSYAPFTTIHLWFDRAVTDMDQAALLDTKIQWMFNKSRIRRDEPDQAREGQYLELVIAASFAELHRTREDILSSAVEELGTFFPEVRRAHVVRSGILKEARATFSVTPGLDAFRPAPGQAGEGLYLAGDWIQTGWPSTMEGGVRSGRLAAEAIGSAEGWKVTCLNPDLPASGLMRLLLSGQKAL